MTRIDPQPSPLIVLFDSTCGLCDRVIQFILKRDPTRRFRFAPLGSQIANDLMIQHGMDPAKIDGVILIDGNRAYAKSAAALRIILELPEPWPLLATLVFIPEWLRDDAYDFVARHRHQWFTPPDACRSPTDEERSRFLA